MRSPVIAFTLLAAAAVSPTLVAGAPTSPNPNSSIRNSARALPQPLDNLAGSPSLPKGHNLNAVPRGVPDLPAPVSAPNIESLPVIGQSQGGKKNDKQPTPEAHRAAEQQLHNPSPSTIDSYTSHRKRAQDQYTAGGNSYSGATTDTSGGEVVNYSKGGGAGGGDGIVNDGDNTGGDGGDGFSGFSFGGDGDGKGAGGNAYSGAVGPSEGGRVINKSDEFIENEEPSSSRPLSPDTGGTGGFNESGDAQGGDASNPVLPPRKRAQDQWTAGGNAYSGASSNVDGGDVINASNDDGGVFNGAPNTGGNAGETFSGEADGGDGNGYGPGGNAYSGAAGSAVGGSVVNAGGFVENEAPQTGGAGGVSQSGDAQGGDA
ncbi:uncharacterized protein LAESUDRAFT_714408 [Laetiporus sulphureus 93-53]|uniref:Uncharacterized protein n=1 Tax=Laetiporus sulphureus 93-53 TaxID=1314785 RepID=A0A165E6S9_9APHY|nr:uncharacterized protein LAESUDRAFT_714408 [Laetiporus sulphureus 93-53]KZT06348.1 hypothetical protein LAESUDRAFT_714408 [Laetiporus sulphureus 93-53]